MSKISVVIPWRAAPSRELAFKKLLNFYENSFPDFDIIISDSLGHKFNLSQARNLGAKKAISNKADLIIFNDADFFASPDALAEAIKYSLKSKEVSVPYTKCYQHVNENETTLFFKSLDYSLELGDLFTWTGLMVDGEEPTVWNPCSGSMTVPSETFLKIGGFEEKIEGWGSEDIVFHKQYFKTYKKTFHYIDGFGQSTYNDPSVRIINPDHQKYL